MFEDDSSEPTGDSDDETSPLPSIGVFGTLAAIGLALSQKAGIIVPVNLIQ